MRPLTGRQIMCPLYAMSHPSHRLPARAARCALAALAALLLAAPAGAASKWGRPAHPAIDASAYPGVDAVILSDAMRLTFDLRPERGFWLNRTVRLVVLTPEGRQRADVSIPLDPSSQLEVFEGRSFGPDGRDERRADGTDVSIGPAAPELGALFARHRRAMAVVPAVDVGDVVEYRYTVRIRDTAWLPDWVFGADVPVLESRIYTADRPEVKLRWTFTRDGQVVPFEPSPTSEGAQGWLEWRLTDLPVGASSPDSAPRLRLAFAAPESPSWDAVAARHRALFGLDGPLPPAIAGTLTAGLDDLAPRDRVAALLDRMAARWLPVEIFAGHGPPSDRPLSRVARQYFIDRRGAASLFLAAASAAGLDARPVLVSTAHRGPLDRELPTLTAFDHVIAAVRIGDDWLYVDPSDRRGAPGELRPHLEGRPALHVGLTDIEWHTLPVSSADANGMRVEWLVDADGTAWLAAHATGRAAAPWRRLALHGEDAHTRLTETLLRHAPAEAIAGAKVEPEGDGVRITASVRWPGLWVPLDGAAGLPLYALIPPVDAAPTVAHREVRVDVPWPASAEAPATTAARTPAGESALTATRADGRLRLSHTLRITSADPTEQAPLRSHAEALRRRLLVPPGR